MVARLNIATFLLEQTDCLIVKQHLANHDVFNASLLSQEMMRRAVVDDKPLVVDQPWAGNLNHFHTLLTAIYLKPLYGAGLDDPIEECYKSCPSLRDVKGFLEGSGVTKAVLHEFPSAKQGLQREFQ